MELHLTHLVEERAGEVGGEGEPDQGGHGGGGQPAPEQPRGVQRVRRVPTRNK